jgi:hypothetical protein
VTSAAVAGLITDEEVQAGKLHIVATVAGDATRRLRSLLPAKAVPAHQVILFRLGMTIPTHIYHLGTSRKRSSVAGVAGRAGRSFQVLVSEEGNAVNAVLKQLVLVGGNAIGGHEPFIAVATGTGSLQVRWKNFGPGIRDRLGAVATVTVKAGGHVFVPLR